MRNDEPVLVCVDDFLNINKWLERLCGGGTEWADQEPNETCFWSAAWTVRVQERQTSRQVNTIFKYSKTCEDEVGDLSAMSCTSDIWYIRFSRSYVIYVNGVSS